MTNPVAERRRAWEIAANARRYVLLARRPELTLDRERRIEHSLTANGGAAPLHLLDAAMVVGASELDRFCASVVAAIAAGAEPHPLLLDVFGNLDADRLLAIYWALPEDRRCVVMTDPIWAYHVARSPDIARRNGGYP